MKKQLPPLRARSMGTARLALILVALGAASLSGPLGCDPPEPTTPQSDSMSHAARSLKIYPRLEGSENRDAVNAFTACRIELSRLGYSTVNSQEKADVIARFEASFAEEPSMMTVMVNGKRKVTVRISVRMTVEGIDGSTLHLGTGSYLSDEDEGAATMARSLLGRLHQSGKLSSYASQLQRDRKDAELKARQKRAKEEAEKEAEEKRQEEERKRKEEEARQKEDALWQASNAEGCLQPQLTTACDGVKKYIEAYPAGRHTAQARQTLQEGEVKIQALTIEIDWRLIELGRCKNPKTTADCTSLKAHLARFPASPHAAEARAILDKVDGKLQMLARLEKQKADAEEAAEEARRKREAAAEEAKAKAEAFKACQEQCKDQCVDWRTGGTRMPCLNRCVARDCR